MASILFSPLQLGSVSLPNRIAVAPMCQYSADDGCASDWHVQHLMNLGMSGAGLVILEATGVERSARITHGCLGLYSDANEAALERAVTAAKRVALPGTVFGVQLQHAGRKASSQRPWEGGGALKAGEDPWQTVAPSAIAFGDGWHTPHAFDDADVTRIVASFVRAARRAVRIGLEVIELHMAHGYFMHAVYSPLTNRRDDRFGGSRDGRMLLGSMIAEAVRDAVPDTVAVGARITGQDWIEGGLTVDDAIALSGRLKDLGLAYVCVSSGGLRPDARITVGPGYQVPFAREVRKATGITTRAVGLIADPHQAEEILASGAADQIALARAVLDDPRWGWHAAEALGEKLVLPPQYARSAAAVWPGAKLARPQAERQPA